MQLEFFTGLTAQIQTNMPNAFKKIGLFNNQFIHSNGTTEEGRNENSFSYPCVYIQFSDFEYKDLLAGVQQFEGNIITHLGFESYLDQDITILQLKQQLFKTVYRFCQGFFTTASRKYENPDYNHNNIQNYQTIYRVGGKDYTGDYRPTLALSSGVTLTISATTSY